MEINLGALAALLISSGLVGGVAGEVGGMLRERWQAGREERSRQAEREHESLLRQDKAHSDAQEAHGKAAAAVRQWVEYEWTERHGGEVDFYNIATTLPADCRNGRDALQHLSFIRDRHPTSSVRKAAGTLHGRLHSQLNTIQEVGTSVGDIVWDAATPSMEDFEVWTAECEALIDDILTPRA